MKNQQNQSNMQTWSTQGQLGAKRLLDSFIATKPDRWPHAFLFFGPEGVGKVKLANEFADKLAGSVNLSPEKYDFDFNQSDSLAELRELIRLSSLTSAGSVKKTFLLKNFQLATNSGLNSLLKTLEEPSASSMFFLISNSNATLPTILSRVIPVRCFAVSSNEASAQLPKLVAESTKGYPELVEQLLNDSKQAGQLEQLLKQLDHSAGGNRSLQIVSTLAELDNQQLQTLLTLWMNRLRNKLVYEPTKGMLVSLRAVQTALEELKRNFNTKLVLQELLLQTKI